MPQDPPLLGRKARRGGGGNEGKKECGKQEGREERKGRRQGGKEGKAAGGCLGVVSKERRMKRSSMVLVSDRFRCSGISKPC